MSHFKIKYTAASDQGARRSNQDNLCVGEQIPFIDADPTFSAGGMLEAAPQQIFCICDGIGGERMGDTAALMTLEAVSRTMRADQSTQRPLAELLLEAAEAAQRSVTEFLSSIGILGGCTLTMLAMRENAYAFVNIGDSPAFLLKKDRDEWTELSCRHNLLWHKRRAGLEAAPSDAGYLMSYIGKQGFSARVMAHTAEGTLEAGDSLLLCSDGITNAIPIDSLRDALRAGTDAATLAARAAAVEYADNSTAICLTVCAKEEQ